jgi:hypothetical protein
MATLTSPGVSVSVIDESAYAGSGEGTIPFILIATAENKTTPDGASVADGTTAANAGVLYRITSQRELLQTFGDPTFQSIGGTVLNGSPINEYGLLAAQSFLGISNGAYVMRADIDLASLEPTTLPPTSEVLAGTVWLDTDESEFGLHALVQDPADPSGVLWQAQTIDFAFVGTPDDAVGTDSQYAVSVNANGSIEYLVKASGTWVGLFVPDSNSGTVPGKLIASDVYPVNDATDTPFVTADISFSWWIKTAPNNNGIDLSFKIKTAIQFESITAPAVAFDTDGATTAAAAAVKLGGTPVTGDYYVSVSGTSSSTAGGDEGASNAGLYKYDGAAWNLVAGYEAGANAPRGLAVDNAYWFNGDIGLNGQGSSTVDILINNGTGSWENFTLPGIAGADMIGDFSRSGTPQLYSQTLNPLVDSTKTVVDYDIWIDTADVDNYPVIYRFKANRWNKIDLSDQTTPNGIVFGDARVSPVADLDGSGVGQGINNGGDDVASPPSLDIDVPDPDLYPAGMILWNTRYSSLNVKQRKLDRLIYIDAGEEIFEDRWVSVSGTNADGSLRTGEDAQRAVVTQKFAEVLVSNEELRSDAISFNLIATPGYPEVIDEMVTLNVDRKETAFIVGDTPFTLRSNGTVLQNWASNADNVASNGQDGLITADPYLGVYYPSGLATNTDGTEVVVPASHMVLRTIAFSDQVGYPWFAPAGLQRGRVSNAVSVGYVDSEGEYVPVTLNEGLRNVLYTNGINPITFIPGSGIVVYGQKTRNPLASALDRVNVARLINYIRKRSDEIARPYLFEPNDKQTRVSVLDSFSRFFAEIVTLRGVQDFLVVCDESNNTPARIDRNELWIDIAIQPTKSVEFIYIPIRIRNTGEDLA